jgi:RNA polymerase sigma-70 factor (ECF subfamily)
MTGDAADAEDVAQEALVRAYRALGRYPPQQIADLRLRGWVWTIAANLCRSRIRTQQRRPSRALEGVDPADPGPGPEDQAMNGDTRDRIASHVLELVWPQRAAVVLRHVLGLGYAEIAESLGRPVGTVKADVHRGLARLRAALEEEETP